MSINKDLSTKVVEMAPDKEQLRKVIADGDDTVHNVLVLCTNGKFKLIQGIGVQVADHLNYVTRWETFSAGNGYVGINASKDDVFLNATMRWANTAWKRYLKTGDTKQY